MSYCPQCFEKQRKIDELEEELVLLKAKLRYQERTVKEGFFGSSTPSSKIPVKANPDVHRERNATVITAAENPVIKVMDEPVLVNMMRKRRKR
jgi:hypothetical protein